MVRVPLKTIYKIADISMTLGRLVGNIISANSSRKPSESLLQPEKERPLSRFELTNPNSPSSRTLKGLKESEESSSGYGEEEAENTESEDTSNSENLEAGQSSEKSTFSEETEKFKPNPSMGIDDARLLLSIGKEMLNEAQYYIILEMISTLPLNERSEELKIKIHGKESDIKLKDVLSFLSEKISIPASDFSNLWKGIKDRYTMDISEDEALNKILNSISEYLIHLVVSHGPFPIKTYINAIRKTDPYLDTSKTIPEDTDTIHVKLEAEKPMREVKLDMYARMVFLTFLVEFGLLNPQ